MNHLAFDRTFAAFATVAVAAGPVAGFCVLGTPGQPRLIMGDRQRLEDLNAIANTLYWRQHPQGFHCVELELGQQPPSLY